jgi:hypothetical protein
LPRVGLLRRHALGLLSVVDVDVQAELDGAFISAGLLELLEISVKGVG